MPVAAELPRVKTHCESELHIALQQTLMILISLAGFGSVEENRLAIDIESIAADHPGRTPDIAWTDREKLYLRLVEIADGEHHDGGKEHSPRVPQ